MTQEVIDQHGPVIGQHVDAKDLALVVVGVHCSHAVAAVELEPRLLKPELSYPQTGIDIQNARNHSDVTPSVTSTITKLHQCVVHSG